MLGSLVYIEVVQQCAAKGAFGQHTLHGMLQDALCTEGLLAQLGRRVEALATGIARVASVHLVGLFLTREDNLLGIDDNYVVATVLVRSEGGLVLSANNLCDLRSKTAYHLVGSVNHEPFFLLAGSFLRYGNGLVTKVFISSFKFYY